MKEILHTFMGFVHQSEDYLRLILIFLCQLSPDICEFLVRRTALTDYVGLAFPTSVIMNIDNAVTARLETSLNQIIVQSKRIIVKVPTEGVVQEELPRHWKSICVQTISLGEMFHLADSVRIVIELSDTG